MSLALALDAAPDAAADAAARRAAMEADAAAAERRLAAERARLLADPGFMQIRDRYFLWRMAEQGAIWGAGAWLALGTGILPLQILGAVLIGAVYARNLEFAHECMHFIAFRSRRVNRVVGTALAMTLLTNFEEWRVSHARHHVDVRDEGFAYQPAAIRNWWLLWRNLLALDHFRAALGKCVAAVRGRMPVRSRSERRVRDGFRLMAACLAGGVAFDLLTGQPVFLWLWFLPLIPAAIFNFHIQLPEHFGCVMDNGSALINSRTITTSRFLSWFVNGNNFHASHHWLANAPIRQLARIDAVIHADLAHTEPSYAAFFGRYYREVFRNIRAPKGAA